jgi:hypothetical protein
VGDSKNLTETEREDWKICNKNSHKRGFRLLGTEQGAHSGLAARGFGFPSKPQTCGGQNRCVVTGAPALAAYQTWLLSFANKSPLQPRGRHWQRTLVFLSATHILTRPKNFSLLNLWFSLHSILTYTTNTTINLNVTSFGYIWKISPMPTASSRSTKMKAASIWTTGIEVVKNCFLANHKADYLWVTEQNNSN